MPLMGALLLVGQRVMSESLDSSVGSLLAGGTAWLIAAVNNFTLSHLIHQCTILSEALVCLTFVGLSWVNFTYHILASGYSRLKLLKAAEYEHSSRCNGTPATLGCWETTNQGFNHFSIGFWALWYHPLNSPAISSQRCWRNWFYGWSRLDAIGAWETHVFWVSDPTECVSADPVWLSGLFVLCLSFWRSVIFLWLHLFNLVALILVL